MYAKKRWTGKFKYRTIKCWLSPQLVLQLRLPWPLFASQHEAVQKSSLVSLFLIGFSHFDIWPFPLHGRDLHTSYCKEKARQEMPFISGRRRTWAQNIPADFLGPKVPSWWLIQVRPKCYRLWNNYSFFKWFHNRLWTTAIQLRLI